MAKQRFKITRYTNPSGEEVFRLSGTLNGDRIRKNFKNRGDAVAERQKLTIRFHNEEPEGRTIWTTLTQAENQEAIAAFSRLKRSGSNRSLSFVVNYFLNHYKEAAFSVSVAEATDQYFEQKSRDTQRGIITERQEKAINMELKKLVSHFDGRMINEITADEIKDYLDSPLGRSKATPSLKTWNNRRGYISTFFRFCHSKKFVGENPILEVPQYRIKQARGTATTLSANEARELMHFLETYRGEKNKTETWWGEEGCMVPYFALTLFAGIRPDYKDGEIAKLAQKDIRLETGVIFIEPEVSKVNEKRSIQIQPNLAQWLRCYPISDYPIIPARRFRDMWVNVRQRFKLSHDVLRHTFITMLVARFRSVGDASLQAGNSEAVIRKHYLDIRTQEEADEFWNIMPQKTATAERPCNSPR